MDEQAEVLDLLEAEYQATLEVIENCNLETVAHPDSGWRIKDVVNSCEFS